MPARLRVALRLTALAVTLAIAVALHGLWRLVRAPSPWPRLYLALAARLFGARPRIVGRPMRRDVVFLSNHVSWMDILVLAGATGTAFVAKDDLAAVPLIGWLCRLNRTIFVRRGDRMAVREQVADLRAALAEAWAVAIFPEGTTGDGVTLLPFKPGLLAALDPPPTGLMVQPVWIDYGAATADLAWVGDEHGKDNALRVLRRRGGFAVTLHFLTPFAPTGDRKAVAAEARRQIATVAGNHG